MPDHEITPSTEDPILRIAQGLRTALRLSGISHRACERELGLSVGYLTRILAGQVQLRVSIVLGICRMAGLPPAAFLTALFPHPKVSEPTDRILKGLAALHRSQPSSLSAGVVPSPPDSMAAALLHSPLPAPSPESLEAVLLEEKGYLSSSPGVLPGRGRPPHVYRSAVDRDESLRWQLEKFLSDHLIDLACLEGFLREQIGERSCSLTRCISPRKVESAS